MSRKLWQIHGRQVLILGLFSTDPHPGNILVTSSGSLGLIDFGQVCELPLQSRLHFAHLLRALAQGDAKEVARWYRELGMRSRGGDELLALNAEVKFGHASILSKETYGRYRELAQQDSLSCSLPWIGRLERLVQILRGTSFMLGVASSHGPTTLWVQIADELLSNEAVAVKSL